MRKLIFSLFVVLSFQITFAQDVKVMTYNIRYDTPSDSVNQWSNRTSKVYALIRNYQPDILGIQEAIHHQVMDLVKNLPEYAFIGVGRDDGRLPSSIRQVNSCNNGDHSDEMTGL